MKVLLGKMQWKIHTAVIVHGKERNVTALILVLCRKGLAYSAILRTNLIALRQSLPGRLQRMKESPDFSLSSLSFLVFFSQEKKGN
jgi:hypothetical protein